MKSASLSNRRQLGLALACAAVAMGGAIVASAQQGQGKPVELFKREACTAPLQNKFLGVCLVRGVIGAEGWIDEPSAQCNDGIFVATAEACLRDGFRLDPKIPVQGPVEACMRMNFGPGSVKMPGYVGMAEIANCPPPGTRIEFKPPKPPMRVAVDSNSPFHRDCFPDSQWKSDDPSGCLVRGEFTPNGHIGNAIADCEDARLEKAASSCLKAFKVTDPFKGATGPICVAMTFHAGGVSTSEYACGTPAPLTLN